MPAKGQNTLTAPPPPQWQTGQHPPAMASIHCAISATPSAWDTERPISGIMASGRLVTMRNTKIEASESPGTME